VADRTESGAEWSLSELRGCSVTVHLAPVVAVLSLVSAWGIWKLQAWSRYSIALIAVFSLAAWVDGTAQNYRKGLWPYEDTLSTVLSFVPAFFLILWWVAITIHTFRLLSPRSR